MLALKLLALRALAAAADTGASSSDPCFADGSNTFTVSLDEAGSWKFLECGDTAMPVLALEKGVTYTFEQRDASNWNYPLAFGTDPSQGDDALSTYYASGVQVDKDAYEDAFVVAQADWLDASGQDQDESEDTSEPDESEDSEEDAAEDEEEDAGEGGDESEDTSEPDESEDTSEPDESEDSEEDAAEDEGEGEGGDEEEDAGEEEADQEEADEEEADQEEDAGESGDEEEDADEDRRRLQAAVGYSVTLTVSDKGDDGDLFYLSNAHDYMAGRIKVYENGAPVHSEDTPAIPTEPNVAPSMAPVVAPSPKPTPSPTASPGNPTASPAPAPTAAPIAAPTPMAPVAAPTPLPSVAAADTIAAASSSGSGGSGTMTSTAQSNIVATVCVVAAVLIGGAFVAWRRSAQAAAKDPAPAIAVQLDAVETDDKV